MQNRRGNNLFYYLFYFFFEVSRTLTIRSFVVWVRREWAEAEKRKWWIFFLNAVYCERARQVSPSAPFKRLLWKSFFVETTSQLVFLNSTQECLNFTKHFAYFTRKAHTSPTIKASKCKIKRVITKLWTSLFYVPIPSSLNDFLCVNYSFLWISSNFFKVLVCFEYL